MSSLARVLVIGTHNNFLSSLSRSLKLEGLDVVMGEENLAGEFDYIVYSAFGDGHVPSLRKAREAARDSASRLIVLADITRKGRSGFAEKDPNIDERHVYFYNKKTL